MFLGNQVFDALDKESKRITLIVGLGFGQEEILLLLQCFTCRSVSGPVFLKLIKPKDTGNHRDQEAEDADNDFELS